MSVLNPNYFTLSNSCLKRQNTANHSDNRSKGNQSFQTTLNKRQIFLLWIILSHFHTNIKNSNIWEKLQSRLDCQLYAKVAKPGILLCYHVSSPPLCEHYQRGNCTCESKSKITAFCQMTKMPNENRENSTPTNHPESHPVHQSDNSGCQSIKVKEKQAKKFLI